MPLPPVFLLDWLLGAVAGSAWTVAKQLDRLAASALGVVTDPNLDTAAQLEVALTVA